MRVRLLLPIGATMISEEHNCKGCDLPCDCDMNRKECVGCEECQDAEFDSWSDNDSPYDRLSEAEQYEIEQREVFNDRLAAFRAEY